MRIWKRKLAPKARPAARRAIATAVETLEPRQLMTMTYGVATNAGPGPELWSTGNSPIVTTMNDLGVKSVRLYVDTTFPTITDWTNKAASDDWESRYKLLRRYKDAGISTTICVTSQETPHAGAQPTSAEIATGKAAINLSNVSNYFNTLLDHTFQSGTSHQGAIADAVDRWEIGNEVNDVRYYPWAADGSSGATHYVNNILIPAANALHANGTSEKVVGAAPTSTDLPTVTATGTPQTMSSWLDALFDAGYLTYSDFANMHPYKTDVNAAISVSEGFMKAVAERSAAAGLPTRPVVATEFNALFNSLTKTSQEWVDYNNAYVAWADSKLESMNYFIFEYESQHQWKSALVTPSVVNNVNTYTARQPYYDMFKAWTAAPTTAPAAPTMNAPGAATASSIALSWTASASATSYKLQRSTSSGGTYTTIATPTTNSAVDQSGLAAGTTYYYRVIAVNAAGDSVPSAVRSASTTPAAPTMNPAGTTTATSIPLSWTAPASATSYKLQRSTSSGGTFATVATPTTNSAVDQTGLAAGTTYYYRVIAVNAAGDSVPSAVLAAATAPAGTVPAATSLYATALTSSSVSLNWVASAAATSYQLQRRANSSSTWADVGAATTGTTATDSGLAANTVYYYQVVAKNSAGSSAGSNELATRTTDPSAGVGAAFVSGHIFVDGNANNTWQSGEQGIAGARVYDDDNNNGQWDVGEIFADTDATGAYSMYAFVAPTGGNRSILLRARMPSGYQRPAGAAEMGSFSVFTAGGTWVNKDITGVIV